MHHDFVDNVLIGYKKIHTDYSGSEIDPAETEKFMWRGNYKFLFELCVAYNFLMKSGQFLKIKWKNFHHFTILYEISEQHLCCSILFASKTSPEVEKNM